MGVHEMCSVWEPPRHSQEDNAARHDIFALVEAPPAALGPARGGNV
jgi:hypothetical protein